MKFYQVDAFTDKPFAGNPAGVVPLQKWLSEEVMQKIASEKNLSETAFIVKNENGYHIRWFTPDYEMDLCGHATLGSAFIVKKYLQPDINSIEFSTEKAGILKVTCDDELFTLDFPSRPPQACAPPKELLQSLGLTDVVEILRSRDYFVVLKDEESVLNVEPDFMLMRKLDTIGVIITARGHTADVVSRCFYPGMGIQEDPVTGSAHCNIIPYWAGKLGKNKFFAKQLSKRGGDLWCESKGDRVLMSGKAIEFLKGEIDDSLFPTMMKKTGSVMAD